MTAQIATPLPRDYHEKQKIQLNRRELDRQEKMHIRSIWGSIQTAQEYAPGIVNVTTASHGGIVLDQMANDKVHAAWRNQQGMYEEDICWAIVAMTYPSLFTDYEKECAESTLRRWMPVEYTKVTGNPVSPEESHVLRENALREKHKADWIVISDVLKGDKVHAIATKGGKWPSKDRREYLIEPKRYAARSEIGHVIDEAIDERVMQPANER